MNDKQSHPSRSRAKHSKENIYKDALEQEEVESIHEVKQENQKLKKLLKEAQAKRTQITRECSHLSKTIEVLEQENYTLKTQVKDGENKCSGEKYRWEELKFLNKQLSSEIEQIRQENESLSQKLRYSSDILERKYEEMEVKTYKRMEQCVKRVKKSIHYLESLSVKNLERTREYKSHLFSDLIENLRKAIELLRGKYYEEFNCENEIEELMNPLKAMQEEIQQKTKQANHFRQENMHLVQQMQKYKSMEKEQIPMFKEGLDKLKKNLAQVRSQLSENEYEKMQIKKKYEERLKEAEYKYNEIFKECRKIKLEKKIYENKLEDMEADVEEEKQRLVGENKMLKKIYQNNNNHSQDSSSSRVSQASSNYRFTTLDKKTQEKRGMKKNYSSNEFKTFNSKVEPHLKSSYCDYQIASQEVSQYNEESSMVSQQNLKQQICRIDQQIIQIQNNLNQQLQSYR